MFGRKPVIAFVLVALVVVLAGCSSVSSFIPSQDKPAQLSKAEKDKLMQQLKTTFINRYPEDRGLVRVYGEVFNGTDREVFSVTVVASDVVTKGKNTTYGKVEVTGIKPGESKAFDIATGLGLSDVGDAVALSIQDAEFK